MHPNPPELPEAVAVAVFCKWPITSCIISWETNIVRTVSSPVRRDGSTNSLFSTRSFRRAGHIDI
jgi:hypothetical protein